jgi:hypothetical protein
MDRIRMDQGRLVTSRRMKVFSERSCWTESCQIEKSWTWAERFGAIGEDAGVGATQLSGRPIVGSVTAIHLNAKRVLTNCF